ncbi:hypothetical protein E9549_18805, partial [Blastococcus sp. MG754426]|uniref:hypothetical protein n=1 Tax=Blastococcus sp. MG754426 TaxID=2570317 RepID=UPI001F190178
MPIGRPWGDARVARGLGTPAGAAPSGRARWSWRLLVTAFLLLGAWTVLAATSDDAARATSRVHTEGDTHVTAPADEG